jgi:hypothetical protein
MEPQTQVLHPHSARTRRSRQIVRQGVLVPLHDMRTRGLPEDPPVRCVSSGYMSDGCSCPATIPSAAVKAAWARELDSSATAGDRFFHFAWDREVWLGFGLADGEVRGVYCPAHRAAREGRAAGFEAQHYAPPARLAASA